MSKKTSQMVAGRLSAEDLRQVQLDLLAYLDRLCRQNGIEYTLIGGSLLGSVRHQGFIPWDDDIDIALRRDHYERLIDLLKQSTGLTGVSHYALSHYSVAKVYQPFAKVYDTRTVARSLLDSMYRGIGVYIDIFPYDNLPVGEKERIGFIKSVGRHAEELASTDFPAFASGSKWYYALARLGLRFPNFLRFHGRNQEVAAQLDRYMQTFDGCPAEERGYASSRYLQKEHFPSWIFDEYEDCAFEGLTVRRISGYDIYLTQLFGDYMQLPPERERVNHSYYKWFWKPQPVGLA